MYSVYIHTNKLNNKRYVGITSKKPKVRWANGKGYSNNKQFTNAINKVGWNGFEHIIVADGLTAQEAAQMERELIALYRTNEREFGYNFTDGGFGQDYASIIGNKIKLKLPKYSEIQKDEIKRILFKKLLDAAYGGQPLKTKTTKITYVNGIKVDEEITESVEYTQPNLMAIKDILDSYSEEPALKEDIEKLAEIYKELDW